MLLSTAVPMRATSPACGRDSCSRTARSAFFLSSFCRSFSPRPRRRQSARRTLARLARVDADFVIGSRRTFTASWSSSRSRRAFSIPLAPSGEPAAGRGSAGRPGRRPRRRFVHVDGLRSSVSAGVARRGATPGFRLLVDVLVAHRVLDEQVGGGDLALPSREVEVAERRGRTGGPRARPRPSSRRPWPARRPRLHEPRDLLAGEGPAQVGHRPREWRRQGLAVHVVEQEDALPRAASSFSTAFGSRPAPWSPTASRSRSCWVCSGPTIHVPMLARPL